MLDQDLFKELTKQNIIAAEVAARVLRDAEASGRSAEEILYEEKLGNEEVIAQIKSNLLGAPYKKIDPDALSQDLFVLIPKETSMTHRVIPIEKKGNLFVVGMLHPDDVKAQEALKFIAKRERLSLGVYLITPTDLARVLRRYASYSSEIDAAMKELKIKGGDEERVISLEEGGKMEEAPVIKIVATILRQAVEILASDIHIEPQRLRLRVRFRVDGELQEVASLPMALHQSIVSRVKVLTSLRLDETRMPQDGRFRSLIGGKPIDFRVATFPMPNGEKVAIRVLDPSIGLKDLSSIGLSDYNIKLMEQAITSPYGMIIITGPTGSGKTTTLYGIMQKLNMPTVNIVSLEDPVEYVMDGVNQSQVKPEIGYNFVSGLRQILRQDPDIIMVGEIRDIETAALAVNAALTGHLMLSTLHTNNAIGVIPRLLDMKVPQFLLPSSLNFMIAQRLILKLCPECKVERQVSEEMANIIYESLQGLPHAVRGTFTFKPPYRTSYVGENKTCGTCKGKGTAGRIALFEIFRMTKELRDILGGTFVESALWKEAERQGMMTMRGDGIIKALQGVVMLEEVVKETNE